MKGSYNVVIDRYVRTDGLSAVRIKFSHKTGRIWLNTKVYCHPDELVEGLFCIKDIKQRIAKQRALDKVLERFDDFVERYEDYGKTNIQIRDAAMLYIFNNGDEVVERTLASTIEEYVARRVQTKGTSICHLSTARKVRECGDILIENINTEYLYKFYAFLTEKGLKTNTRSIQMRNIRTVVNYAIDEGYTTSYPFRKFKIKQEQTKKRSLHVEDVRRLIEFRGERWQEEARDMWLLQLYLIGINNADLFQMTSLTDGRCVYNRQKTHKLYDIAVPKVAQDIFNKYRGKTHLLNVSERYKDFHDYVKRTNYNLKTIGMTICNGKKHAGEAWFPDLSLYWARHTWATLAAEIDIPIETIARALGHSNGMDTTNIYINFSTKKIDDAQNKVIDYIFGDYCID